MAADNRVKPFTIYLDSSRTKSATSANLNLEGGTTIVQTSAGPVIQNSAQQGSFDGEGVVQSGDELASFLMNKWINREFVSTTLGVIGTKVAQAQCTVSNVKFGSQQADGSATWSATFTMVNGKPDLV
jgi:DNA-directed RNA polymerase alpha subunit